MRILHLVHQYPPDDVGGVELHTQSVARELARRGHEVGVFFRQRAEGRGLESWEEQGVRVWAARDGALSPTGRLLATFHAPTVAAFFERVLEEMKPEIVHIHHLMGLPVALAHEMSQRDIPYVVTLHDYWWGCANAQLLTNDREEICDGPDWWLNCGRCALARAGVSQLWLAPALAPLFAYRYQQLHPILQQAQRLIAPTDFTRDSYERMGFSVEKVQVIPHGIALPPNAKGLESRPDPGQRTLCIAYVGGIARQKGVHVLVEAMNGLPEEQVHLSIFGDLDVFPQYVSELRALARHSGIHFRGRLPNDELLKELARFDVLVVPSLWYETAALVIQEAFAVGLPVIASDLGALSERVRDGIDGLLVPPGDPLTLRAALGRLLDEPNLLPQLRAGIHPVRLLEEQVDEIEPLYREVVE
ncbi:MAG: glycosyltransferase family 4 protein [Chloroflexota bacterium]|nr:glycosyltransferase family 4 protein [Chloroflexota bacterium]